MTREELLEMAGLDVLGLLEPDERVAFEEAFRDAGDALKAEIRRLQEGAIDLEESLPDVTPDPALKSRVIHAVAGATRLALRDEDVEATVATQEDLLFTRGRVSAVWRIAALVLLTTSVGFGWIAYVTTRANQVLAQYFRNNTTHELLQAVGVLPKYYLLHPDADHVALEAAQGTRAGRALLAYVLEERAGCLIAENLPASDYPYRLMVETADGEERLVTTFMADGTVIGITFDDLVVDEPQAQWTILGVDEEGAYAALYTGGG